MPSRSSPFPLAVLVAALMAGCITVGPAGPGVSGSGALSSPGTEPAGSGVAKPGESTDPGRTRRPRRSKAPASAPAAPTDAPTAPTDAPTAAPGATATIEPTDAPTDAPTDPPAPTATLSFSLPPVYGSTSLASGFLSDPFSVGVTAGGPLNVSYLGSGCSGHATSAPSFTLNYTPGLAPMLRFYFIGAAGSDTTMVVNTPSGSYVCVDDSFGTLNPTRDFDSPAKGRYDIWIGTFEAGASVAGTLYVTEDAGNHP